MIPPWRRGARPNSRTVAHKWLTDQGISVDDFAGKAGVHFTLAHRHLSGRGAVSKRIAREYERAFPGGPWKSGLLQMLPGHKRQ